VYDPKHGIYRNDHYSLVPHARHFGLLNIPLGILVISDGLLHIYFVGFLTKIHYLVHWGKCIKKHLSTAEETVVAAAALVPLSVATVVVATVIVVVAPVMVVLATARAVVTAAAVAVVEEKLVVFVIAAIPVWWQWWCLQWCHQLLRLLRLISLTLWCQNPKVHHRTHKSPLTIPILSQVNPLHPPTNLPKVDFDPTLPSTPWSFKWSFSLWLSHQNPVHVSPLSHASHIPCPPHSPSFDLPNIIW
jgi:hypothetical protein